MNAVHIPEAIKDREAEVRKTLLTEFNLEIGAGLGPLAGKIWRVGIMGYSCKPENVMLCLSALGSVLSDMGLPIHVGDAEAAAHHAYAHLHAQRRAAEEDQGGSCGLNGLPCLPRKRAAMRPVLLSALGNA